MDAYHNEETAKIAAERQKAAEEIAANEVRNYELKLLSELKAKYPERGSEAPKE